MVYCLYSVIGENNWNIPEVEKSMKAQASRLRTKIRDIKKGTVTNIDAIKPLPRRRPSSSSTLANSCKSPSKDRMSAGAYDPRAKVDFTTESGEPLPSSAIAYGHIPMSQFKGNTVKRLDVGIPMTYALKHIPLATTVPMLKVLLFVCNRRECVI